jgi:hypothetical protein
MSFITIVVQQRAIYRHRLAAFLSVETLPPGPVDESVLSKHNIAAENIPILQMQRAEPHFLGPLSDSGWLRECFSLPDIESTHHDRDEMACYIYRHPSHRQRPYLGPD